MKPNQDCKPLMWFSTTKDFVVSTLISATDIHKSIRIADCFRLSGKMKEASDVLDAIDERIAELPEHSTIDTSQLRTLINDNDSTDKITHESQVAEKELPPLWIRGINLAGAFSRWAGAGFKMRNQSEIDGRLAICQACDKFNGDACSVCGCNCNANGLLNKLALHGSACPLDKWS